MLVLMENRRFFFFYFEFLLGEQPLWGILFEMLLVNFLSILILGSEQR